MSEPIVHMVGRRNGRQQVSARCYEYPHPVPSWERYTRTWAEVTCPVCRLLRPPRRPSCAERLQAQVIGTATLCGHTQGISVDLDPDHRPVLEPGRRLTVLLLDPLLDPCLDREAPDV